MVSVEGSSSVWVDLVGAGLTVSPHGPGLKILLVGFVMVVVRLLDLSLIGSMVLV